MQRPNRFLSRPKVRRLTAFVTAVFPLREHDFAYDLSVRLSQRLDADHRFAYQWPADPATTHANTKRWLSRTLFAPASTLQENADIEHFRLCDSERFAAAMALLGDALGLTEAQLLAEPTVRGAFSLTRITKAWAPDVLVSFYAYEASAQAVLAAALLDLPRVLFLYELPTDPKPIVQRMLPLNLRSACQVVVRDEAMRAALVAQHGEELAATVMSMEMPDWEAELARRCYAELRGRPSAFARNDLGPRAAFRTRTLPALQPKVTPFVVTGAERTGSNLLIDMLVTHPDVVSAGELFNTRMIEQGTLDTQLPEDVDRAEFQALRTQDPGACCLRLHEYAEARGAHASGFKLLHYHAVADNRIVDHLLASPELRVVHLLRDDRLARWVSQVRAERTDKWWTATDEARRDPGPVTLSAIETMAALEFGELQDERCHATFAEAHLLELSYEQLVADLPTRTGEVLEWLGVPPRELQPQSQKTGDRDVRKLVANWDAIAAAFADTRWQDQFARD